MRGNKGFKPRDGHYPKVDGKFVKPERSDAYLTVITKFYQPDGSITTEKWYHMLDDIAGWSVEDGCFKISKHNVAGRHQISIHPMTEIVRVDFNAPSAAYFQAFENWTMQEYGMSYKDWQEMTNESEKAEQSFNFRSQIAEKMHVDVSNVIDLDGGHFAIKLDGDDD